MAPSHDPFLSIFQTLPQPLPPPATILPPAKQLHRLLNTKIPKTTKHDTPQIRIATCLEYVLRKQPPCQTPQKLPPLQQFSRAIGSDWKIFRDVHNRLIHYLEALDDQNHDGKEHNSSNNNNNNNKGDENENDLSIRLGAYLKDVQGVTSRTQHLLRELKRYLETSVGASNELLGDWRRKRDVYYSACFYYVAVEEEEDEKRQRKNKKFDENDDSIGLTKEKVVIAKNLNEREFDSALGQIKKIVNEMMWSRKRKRGDDDQEEKDTGISKKKKKKKLHLWLAQNPTIQEDQTTTTSPTMAIFKRKPPPNEEFQTWKEEVLNNAKRHAKEELLVHEQQNCCEGVVSDSILLKTAAEEVLKRHGINLSFE